MQLPGVYFLKSSPSRDTFSERIYVGEGEKVGVRLKQQLKDPNKDFEEIILFVSRDAFVTKAHVRYLESTIVKLALEAKTAEVANDNIPSLPLLHEADVSDMEFFLDQIKLILPINGFRCLIKTVLKDRSKDSSGKLRRKIYSIKSPVIKAKMYESDQGFVVCKGSEANKTMAPAVHETYRALQRKLIEAGIFADKGKYFEFLEDTVFYSPSAAANIVLGRQTPGPIMWLDEKGVTYKQFTNTL